MEKILMIIKAIIVAVVFAGAVYAIASAAVNTYRQMTPAQRKEAVIAWLLQAMLIAEQQFGGGTGKLKLSDVYAKFIVAFPKLAEVISFETFSGYVEEVKPAMDHLIQTNEHIAQIVNGGGSDENG